MHSRILSFVFGLAIAALLAAPSVAEICVDPGKSGCEDTIQAAVDAAVDGETIKIGKGNFEENVIITADGIILEGKGIDDTIVRGDPSVGDTIIIFEDTTGVTIRNLTARGGIDTISFEPGATGGRLEKVKAVGAVDGSCVDVEADDLTIEKGEIGSCSEDCVDVNANGFLMTKTDIHGCGDGAVEVLGNDATIEKSELTRAEDDSCIRIVGNNASVMDNEISVCDEDGVLVIGDNAFIDNNEIWAVVNDGIDVECPVDGCTAGQVSKNDIEDANDDGIDLFGGVAASGTFIVDKNSICNAEEDGVDITEVGEFDRGGYTLTKNDVEDAGSNPFDDCYDIGSDDNVVEKNSAEGCTDDGFSIQGDDNVLVKNTADEAVEDGFDVGSDGIDDAIEGDDEFADDNILDNNKAKKNGNHGFQISGAVDEVFLAGARDTMLTKNNASKNLRADYCDAGEDTVDDNNKFKTVDEDRNENGNCKSI